MKRELEKRTTNFINKSINNDEIYKILSSNLQKKNMKNSLITHCDSNLKIIYCKKGAICIYCRTWFKILSSLNDHQKKCCGGMVKSS